MIPLLFPDITQHAAKHKPMCFFISHNGSYRCLRRVSDGIAIDHGFLGYQTTGKNRCLMLFLL